MYIDFHSSINHSLRSCVEAISYNLICISISLISCMTSTYHICSLYYARWCIVICPKNSLGAFTSAYDVFLIERKFTLREEVQDDLLVSMGPFNWRTITLCLKRNVMYATHENKWMTMTIYVNDHLNYSLSVTLYYYSKDIYQQICVCRIEEGTEVQNSWLKILSLILNNNTFYWWCSFLIFAILQKRVIY